MPPSWECVDSFPSDGATRVYYVIDDYERPRTATTNKCFGHGGMSNVCRMNDLVDVRHQKLIKFNVLSIKKTAVVVVSGTCGAPLRTTEL